MKIIKEIKPFFTGIPLKSSVPPQIFNLPREKIKRGNPEHFVTTLQSIFPEIEGLMKLSANKLQSNESFLLISKVHNKFSWPKYENENFLFDRF